MGQILWTKHPVYLNGTIFADKHTLYGIIGDINNLLGTKILQTYILGGTDIVK